MDISDQVWRILLRTFSALRFVVNTALSNVKIFHPTYFTKSLLASIYPNISPACDSCGQPPPNLVHSLSFCRSLSHICTAHKPLTALFVVSSCYTLYLKAKKHIFLFTTLLARRDILIFLFHLNLPSVKTVQTGAQINNP